MYKKLSEFCFLKGGSGFPEKYQGSPEGEIPFIKVSDMNSPGNERFITTAHHYISLSDAKLLNATVFNAGTIVFAKVGAALLLNRRRILTGSTIIDNNMMAAIPLNIDAEFLYHFLCSVDFAELVQSGALPSVNQDQVGRIKVPIFSKPVQKKIAAILTSIDTAIEKTEALIAKYQQIKAGLMHDLFTRGVLPNGKLRPPRSQAPELYQETAIGWIPKTWDVALLGNFLADIQTGNSPSCQEVPATSGEWGVLKVSAVHPGGFRSEQNKTITDIRLIEPSFEVKSGDLLITRANTPELVGLVCLVENPQPKLMLCDKTLRLVVKEENFSKAFMFLSLQQHHVRMQIENLATGTSMSMKNISQNAIRSIQIAQPPLNEQVRVITLFEKLSKRLRAEEIKSNNLRAQKIGLMQDLLTGKVPVQVDQPDTEVTA